MRAYVLMTALPPTKGHLRLIQFARCLAPSVHVIVSTQPSEPFPLERIQAIQMATRQMPTVRASHVHREMEQNPEAPGFREMWKTILAQHGMSNGDLFVASEDYGIWVAEMMGATFLPYDPYREITHAKATWVRNDSERHFADILPEFQHHIRQTVTVFGAESTGKTTLAKKLSKSMRGHFLMEWARPYLEVVGTEITTDSMTAIWRGQKALQDHAQDYFRDKPWIIQDTDLFSTVGYWDFWNMNTPPGLVQNALARKSDLYLVTKSNIPFEEDPIRYGGDKRESDDQYWIDLCERYGLNYRVLDASTITGRMLAAEDIMTEHWEANVLDRLRFNRVSN